MRLFGYEIKKALSNGYVILLIAVLLAANVVFSVVTYNENLYGGTGDSAYAEEVWELYKSDPDFFWSEYERLCADEEEAFATGLWVSYTQPSDYGGGEIGDLTLFNYVINECIERDSGYHDDLSAVITQSMGVMRTTIDENTYNYRYQKKVVEIYTYLDENLTLSDEIFRGWDNYFYYGAEIMFTMAAVLLLVILITTGDYYSGFFAIEKTCAKGRGNTALAKFAAVVFFGAILTVIFFASTLVSAYLTMDMSPMSLQIQTAAKYELCPFEISIGQFLVLSLFLKILSAVLFASVTAAILSVFRRISFGIVGGAALLAASYFLKDASIITFGQAKYLNIWSFYNAEDVISRYRAIDLLENSVSLLWVAAVIFALLVCLSLAVGFFAFSSLGGVRRCMRRRERGRKEKGEAAKKRFSVPIFKSTNVLFYEQYKRVWIIPVFIAAVILKIAVASDYYSYENYTYMRNYRSYIEIIEGEYTKEKYDYLQSELAACEEIIAYYGEYEALFLTGEYPTDEYLEYTREYSAATAKKTVLLDIIDTADYLSELYRKGIVGSFINELDYSVYTNRGTEWILTVCVLLFGVSSFTMERRKTSSSDSMTILLSTTPKGRRSTFIAKYVISAGYSMAMFIIFFAVNIVYYAKSLVLPPSDALLLSVSDYSGAPAAVTIGEHFIFMSVLSFIGVFMTVTFCFLLSYLMRDGLTLYILSALILLAPGFLERTGFGIFGYFDVNKLQDTESLYMMAEENSAFGVYLPIIIVFLSVTAVLAAMLVLAERKIRSGGR
ncbi:MAG: hypothetical protein LUD43_05715 [Firmicutes bacterium]|nr:hypothetical protein [Bacillota bacterium]